MFKVDIKYLFCGIFSRIKNSIVQDEIISIAHPVLHTRRSIIIYSCIMPMGITGNPDHSGTNRNI